MTKEPTIPLRVLVSGMPPKGFEGFEDYVAVEPGIQRKDAVEPGEDFEDGALAFSFTLRVDKDPKTGQPNFLGDYAFGTPQEPFVCICWCGDKDGERKPFRHMKVPLKSVAWEQVEAVAAAEDKLLEAKVSARAEDGGPACASVPLLGEGWRIAEA